MFTDATSLKSKTETKRAELSRRIARLKSMQGVRPAYMDEFEKVQSLLSKAHVDYVLRARNLAWLESLVDDLGRHEADQIEANETSLRRMQEKMKEDELKLLRGDGDDPLDVEDDEVDEFGLYSFICDRVNTLACITTQWSML
jgi:clusterin-associated protein 1